MQLKDTFKEIINETFDKFQFFLCTQNPGESREQFHSRIKQKAALCNWGDLEDSLVKSIFMQGMANPRSKWIYYQKIEIHQKHWTKHSWEKDDKKTNNA